jgi:Xaa-Pro dipeptidase
MAGRVKRRMVMFLSERERGRRHSELKKRMEAMGVDLLLVLGDTEDMGLKYGNLRYLINCKVIFGNSVLIFPSDQEPVLFMFGAVQANWGKQLSWIKDVRDYEFENFLSDVVSTVKSIRPKCKRIGVASLASLPISWYQKFIQEFPAVELIEMTPLIREMRYTKSEEEIELVRRSAQLADKGFEEILKSVKPGMTEFEVLALMERPMREGGGDDFFDLIFSGPFVSGVRMEPFAPTGRKIQSGDSLLFEITPRYGGYWGQLVRIVNVGKENRLLSSYYRAIREGIEVAVQYFKPGITLGNAVNEAKKAIASRGFELCPPMGHICGLDLIEGRVKLESEDILKPGMIFVFHPSIRSGDTLVFAGETYVITSDGFERLHRATDELRTVS